MAAREDLNTAFWTADIRVSGWFTVRVRFYKRTFPIDRRFVTRCCVGCRRAGGFNTGWIVG